MPLLGHLAQGSLVLHGDLGAGPLSVWSSHGCSCFDRGSLHTLLGHMEGAPLSPNTQLHPSLSCWALPVFTHWEDPRLHTESAVVTTSRQIRPVGAGNKMGQDEGLHTQNTHNKACAGASFWSKKKGKMSGLCFCGGAWGAVS